MPDFLADVQLLEHVLMAGLARGQVDVDTMARLIAAHHRPENALLPAAVPLTAFSWALAELPEGLGASDTLWLVSEATLELAEGRDRRIGPTEWARVGGLPELRRAALACATLSAVSGQLRESSVGDEALSEIAADIAYGQQSPEQVAERLALAAGFSPVELRAASLRVPGLIEKILRLTHTPFRPILKTRGIAAGPSPRALEFWQELLRALAALEADERPLAIWVAPLWVTDLVSPYVREVRPLLAKWAEQQPELAAMAERLASGDEDASYACAELFSGADAEVQRERDRADATAGVYTVADPEGVRLAKVCDASRFEIDLIDPRVGALESLSPPAPIVIVLEQAEADVGYALARLLCDVKAQFRGVSICLEASTLPCVGPAPMFRRSTPAWVCQALVAEGPMGDALLAAPAEKLPGVRALSLPDTRYLTVLGAGSAEQDVVFSDRAAQQSALVQAVLRGDLSDVHVEQRLWVRGGDEAHALEAKRAQVHDAIAIWRRFLGFGDQRGGEAPPKAGKRERPVLPAHRLRV